VIEIVNTAHSAASNFFIIISLKIKGKSSAVYYRRLAQ